MPPQATNQNELWTTRRLLTWMRQTFTKKGLDSPGLMAEMLLAHVLKCERLKLHMDADRAASDAERDTLRGLVSRALNHEPVQYLVGEGWFFGLPFHVDRRVLIPRPGTATIIEEVVRHSRVTPGFGMGSAGEGVLIADLCTGSGCIAVTLLKQLAKARAIATDLSKDALAVAETNAKRHGVADRLELLAGDLLAPLAEHPASRGEGSIHYLACNPPYIPDHEWDAVEPNVRNHEPHHALRGGPDGLGFLRRLLADGPRFIRSGGLMLVEIADSTAAEALALAQRVPSLAEPKIINDFEGLPRVLLARKN